MIERIDWPQGGVDGALSPFLRGPGERPLRVTLDVSEDESLPPDHLKGLGALRELSRLPEVEALSTQVGQCGRLQIGTFESDSEYIEVAAEYEDGRRRLTRIPGPHRWLPAAATLLGQADQQHPDVQDMLDDLITARAHRTLGQDILVTSSPFLLRYRSAPLIRETNPLTPSEAARIVGLFLRSRDNFTYRVEGNAPRSLNRGMFYLVLVSHRLPNLWRYNSGCLQAGRVRQDDTEYLGQSVLERCIRALQARDAVGRQFYLPQDNDTRDSIMYHFDYLTLLVAGVFDAQARIAHRCYRISQPVERWASFRRADFRRALQECDAADLYGLVSDQIQDVMTLLYQLRNTIHGAGLPTLAYVYWRGTQPQASFVSVLPEYCQDLWDAAERHGSGETWGLSWEHTLLLEPYAYSVALVAESFKLINGIAAATDVTGLFPDGSSIPALRDSPPEDNVFGERTRRRLNVLGW